MRIADDQETYSLCRKSERNKDNSNCDTLHAICVYDMYMCMHNLCIEHPASVMKTTKVQNTRVLVTDLTVVVQVLRIS